MVYIQYHHYNSEDIIKYSQFQWRFFVIHKLMSSCMIGFRTNQVTNTNKYIKLQTYIELRTRAGSVCCVIGYEPRDALGRLTEERCGTKYRSLVRTLRSLPRNLLC